MSKRGNGVALKLPTCRFCGNQCLLQKEVVASRSYCETCRNERRITAARILGAKPIELTEGIGPYVMPRARRAF